MYPYMLVAGPNKHDTLLVFSLSRKGGYRAAATSNGLCSPPYYNLVGYSFLLQSYFAISFDRFLALSGTFSGVFVDWVPLESFECTWYLTREGEYRVRMNRALTLSLMC